MDLEAREAIVHGELEDILGRSLVFEGGIHNQDASFSVAIRLIETPGDKFVHVCNLRFSNYGHMVAVRDENYDGSPEYLSVFETARICQRSTPSFRMLDEPAI